MGKRHAEMSNYRNELLGEWESNIPRIEANKWPRGYNKYAKKTHKFKKGTKQ